MPEITEESTVEEVAAIVSDALDNAGITATLSGGSAVTIYSDNAYLSRDLDFVTSAMVADLEPVLKALGFEHTGVPRLSQFSHPKEECGGLVSVQSFPGLFVTLKPGGDLSAGHARTVCRQRAA